MRILHINSNYADTALHRVMIEHFQFDGDEHVVFVPVHTLPQHPETLGKNVVIKDCFRKWDRLLFDWKQRKILHAIEAAINVAEFDLIHAYTVFTDGNVAKKLSEKYGIPYIVAVRNTDVNAFFHYMVHLRGRGIRIMNRAQAVLYLSEAYHQQMIQTYIPAVSREPIEKKTHIIPNGIDEFWLNRIYSEKNIGESLKRFQNHEIRLIFAGRLDRNKNIGCVIQCMQQMKKIGWKPTLTVLGAATDPSQIELVKACAECSYIGPVPKEKLIDYYRDADVYVMPSHTETFGLVYVEAMSQGLPVVYTKGQGFDGQFAEGTVGYHVDDHDPLTLVQAVQSITTNYATMSSNAVRYCRSFSWNDICTRYHALYEEITR